MNSEVIALNREAIASRYIRGDGIEIGALHNPLNVPKSANLKYVDRISVSNLRKQYPELDSLELVNVDIIDDGEHLENIQDSSQDFVIVNHFLEHCQNPILAISNIFRVLKFGGILYIALPDKRYTFDIDRPVTPIEHYWRDYKEGPEWSKRQHFHEWTKFVDKIQDDAEVEKHVKHLIDIDYSIHYHVLTQHEMLELVQSLKQVLNLEFEVEQVFKNGTHEVILILRKGSSDQETQTELEQSAFQFLQVKAELEQCQSQLHQVKAELEQCQSAQVDLEQAKNRIKAMESSKFWKLRTGWFRLKQMTGLPGDE